MPSITIFDQSIPYQITRHWRKTISISLNPRGELDVKAPKLVPERAILNFIESKQDWIFKHYVAGHHARSQPRRTYVTGDTLPFFGKELKIVLNETGRVDKARIFFVDKEFHIMAPVEQAERERARQLKPQLVAWYMTRSLQYLKKRSQFFADRIEAKVAGVRLKEVTSIWGSCSADQYITYNWKLALAPRVISDYVIAHEVSHLIHKHHQRTFWECVRSFDPEYTKHVRWLKRYGNTLTL